MNLLADSSNSLIGGLYLVLMFLFCCSVVYIAKAVYIMINNVKLVSKDIKEKPVSDEKVKHEPEKIYYIVERKKAPVRRRVSSEPKRIFFSEK